MSRIIDWTSSVDFPLASGTNSSILLPTHSSTSATSNEHISIEGNSSNFENSTLNLPTQSNMPSKVTRPGHEIAPMYSTRATKRKIDDVAPATEKKQPLRSSRKVSQEDSENESPPPAKRTKKSISSERSSSAAAVVNEVPEVPEVPTVKVNSPSEEVTDEELIQSQVASMSPTPVKSTRGRGRGRGRARGSGRGRGGGRGGSGFPFRATPMAVEFVPFKGSRGKGGHRVKKSGNARIQALYHRKHALKHQFKHVAIAQRDALDTLAEKALELTTDPNYHKTLPEHNKVAKELNSQYQRVVDRLNAASKIKQDFLKRQREINEDYERQFHEDAARDKQEEAELKVKERALHVLRQAETGGSLENTPIYRGILGDTIKQIEKSIPVPFEPIFGPGKPTIDEERRKPGRKPKNASPIKKPQDEAPVRMKSSLYHPAAQKEAVTSFDDPSMAPTPAGGSESEGESSESDTDAQPTDKYGTYMPIKTTWRSGEPREVRFSQKPHFKFDDDEIGIREHHNKRNNRNELSYIGVDPSPNPKMFHFDQFARGHNSAHNQADDLDKDLVAQHKVHPTYGLCVPGSVNPDYDELTNPTFKAPTDWTEPLPRPKPIIYFQVTAKNEVETQHTSRSAWMIETEKDWNEYYYPTEDSLLRTKMRSVLLQLQEEPTSPLPPPPPVTPPLRERVATPKIDQFLLKAVNEAPPLPVPVTTPRSQGYDPVRDTGYQTPYQPIPRPKDRSGLTLLADAVELRGSMAPTPSTQFRMQRPDMISRSWAVAVPPPLPAPQPIQQQQQQFFQYQQPQAPPQFSPTRNNQNVPGGFRELRPAPPQPRNPGQQPSPNGPGSWYYR